LEGFFGWRGKEGVEEVGGVVVRAREVDGGEGGECFVGVFDSGDGAVDCYWEESFYLILF
jgi:hypothetical protein